METPDPFALFLASLRVVVREAVVEALASADVARSHVRPTRLLTKQETADALGISSAQLDRLCRAGRVPFIHVGDVRRFDLAAVLEALKDSTPGRPASTDVRARPTARTVAPVRLLSRGKR